MNKTLIIIGGGAVLLALSHRRQNPYGSVLATARPGMFSASGRKVVPSGPGNVVFAGPPVAPRGQKSTGPTDWEIASGVAGGIGAGVGTAIGGPVLGAVTGPLIGGLTSLFGSIF